MTKWYRTHTWQLGLAGLAMGVVIVLAAMTVSSTGTVAAAPQLQEEPSNESCLFCHQEEGMTTEIGGQPLPLTIDPEKYEASVHGTENLACVDCHTNITSFPHPEVTAASPRDFTLEMYPTCQQCHAEGWCVHHLLLVQDHSVAWMARRMTVPIKSRYGNGSTCVKYRPTVWSRGSIQ